MSPGLDCIDTYTMYKERAQPGSCKHPDPCEGANSCKEALSKLGIDNIQKFKPRTFVCDVWEVSTALGDPDWESSEKSGLMVDRRTGDDVTLYRRIFQLLEGSSLAFALKEQYINNYKRYHHVRHTVGKVFSLCIQRQSITKDLFKRLKYIVLSEGSRLPKTERENPIVLCLWSSYEVRFFASRQLASLPSFAVYISRRFKLP